MVAKGSPANVGGCSDLRSYPLVTVVKPGSPAARAGIKVGDRLVAVNGKALRDIIDYQLACADDRLIFTLMRGEKHLEVGVEAGDTGQVGLALEKSIFDRLKPCQNQCVFCFIDQLPAGCRPTLKIKDDDFRLSFLYGNFVTLTNLSGAELKRIKDQKLSPLYASIHSLDPDTRRRLIGPPRGDRGLTNLKQLLADGIEVHLQIVLVPRENDGEGLLNTLRGLLSDFSQTASVGVVPVGLTDHRQGLPDIRPVRAVDAQKLLDNIEGFQKTALEAKGYNWVYAADEFYLTAGRPIPPAEEYEDFPQVENGIGLTRLFLDGVDQALSGLKTRFAGDNVTVVTGELAAPVLRNAFGKIGRAAGCRFSVVPVRNLWLGGGVSVTGLLAGSDIIYALGRERAGAMVLVPDVCLNEDGQFVDDLRVSDVIAATGARVAIVPGTGFELVEALGGLADEIKRVG